MATLEPGIPLMILNSTNNLSFPPLLTEAVVETLILVRGGKGKGVGCMIQKAKCQDVQW